MMKLVKTLNPTELYYENELCPDFNILAFMVRSEQQKRVP